MGLSLVVVQPEYPDLTDEVKKRNEEIVGLRAALEQLMVEQHQAQQIMPNSTGNTTPRGQISGAAATQPSPGTRMNNIKAQLETGEKHLDAQSLAEQVCVNSLYAPQTAPQTVDTHLLC